MGFTSYRRGGTTETLHIGGANVDQATTAGTCPSTFNFALFVHEEAVRRTGTPSRGT
jgi:hypothetical protein